MNSPTPAGFLAFIRSVMGITTAVLPDSADVIQWCYQIALDYVNQVLCVIPSSSTVYPGPYAQAVYFFAGDRLINFARDLPGAPSYMHSDPPLPYFEFMRKALGINSFVGGVISASNDDTTGQSMVVPKQMEDLTFMDLQLLKTPYGRQYLGIASSINRPMGIS